MSERGPARVLAPERLDRPFRDPLVARLLPPLARGVHWGLERTERALAAVGDPHRAYPTLHIGGTNGKGSVASTLAAVLNRAGVRTACYTSPHLCSFRERIQIGGEALSEESLLARGREVEDVMIRFGLTFFEAATVLAFHTFAGEEVDLAVVEVGLGGRLDATNVVRPLVSAVTNVALDHSDYLGDTVEQIAREKVGIVKPGVPLVTAETDPGLLSVFAEVTRQEGAPLVRVDVPRRVRDVEVATDHTDFTLDTRAWGELQVRTPLVGRHQAANAAVAVEVLEYLPDRLRPDARTVVDGISSVRYPGRDQIEALEGGTWLFDVAHNTAGILSLVDTVDRLDLPRPLSVLTGVLGDKDWRTMLPPLFSRADMAVLTQPPSAPPERRWNVRAAAASVATICPMVIEEDFVRAVARAREAAGKGTVVVTGSCHTVGNALSVLGLEPLE